MRIFYISHSLIPSRQANAIHVVKMCQAFAHLKHTTSLFAVDNQLNAAVGAGTEFAGDEYAFYGVAPIFDIVYYGKHSTNLGIRALRLLKLYWQIRRATHQPDLLFGRHAWGLAVLSGLGIPSVLDVHAPPESWLARWMLRRLFMRPNFWGLVVISKALRQEYMRQFPQLPPERILVAHDGADLPAADVPAEHDFPISRDHICVGYTGHLYPGKGMEVIVPLARRLPAMHFHVIGGEPGDIAYWREQGVPDNLFIHGYVSHNKVSAVLAQFDIVLAPYQPTVTGADHSADISRWMSPLKLFEYMAAGKAIVCSNLPVLQEVLQDGETALLVSPQDVDGWAQAIARLAENADLRERLGANAYALLCQEYTWEERARKILDWLGQRMGRESTVAAQAYADG